MSLGVPENHKLQVQLFPVIMGHPKLQVVEILCKNKLS